jgi:hypothetical protein
MAAEYAWVRGEQVASLTLHRFFFSIPSLKQSQTERRAVCSKLSRNKLSICVPMMPHALGTLSHFVMDNFCLFIQELAKAAIWNKKRSQMPDGLRTVFVRKEFFLSASKR